MHFDLCNLKMNVLIFLNFFLNVVLVLSFKSCDWEIRDRM